MISIEKYVNKLTLIVPFSGDFLDLEMGDFHRKIFSLIEDKMGYLRCCLDLSDFL